MKFEQPGTENPSEKNQNNRLLELGDPLQAADVKGKIQENIEKTSGSLTDEQKEKRMKRHLYKFEIITKVKDYYEERWGKMNRSMIKDNTLSPGQITQRNRFIDTIGKDEILKLLEQWQVDWEEAASEEENGAEKEDLYLYVDAIQELQGDVANW